MPRTKRRFEDRVPESDDSDDNQDTSMTTTTTTAYPRSNFGGGKQLNRMYGGGGGKQIRTMPQPDSDDDSDDDDDDENEVQEQQPQHTFYGRGSGGGKHFRPSTGKSLRYDPSNESDDGKVGGKSDDDEEDQSEEEAPTPQGHIYAARGGGKSLMRHQVNNDDDDDDDDDGDESEPETQPQGHIYGARGGGKMLRRPQESEESSDDDDEEEVEDNDDEEEQHEEPEQKQPQPSGRIFGARGGGKSLMRHRVPTEETEQPEKQEEQQDYLYGGGRGGGKSLFRHAGPAQQESEKESESDDDSEEEEEEEIKPRVITGAVRGGGKVLRPYDDGDDDENEKDNQDDDDDDDDDDDEDDEKDEQSETNDMEIDSDSDSEVPVTNQTEPKRSSTRTTRRSTRLTEEVVEDAVQDIEESSGEEMEESEESSDEESSEDEIEQDMDRVDQTDLVENEADQKYLDSLPEIERESILAERFEKKKAEMDMKRALRENKRKEKETKRLASGKATKAKKKTQKKKKTTKSKKNAQDTSNDFELAKEIGLGRSAKLPTGVETKRKALLAQLRKGKELHDEDSDLDYGNNDDDDSDEEYAEIKQWKNKKTKRPVSEDNFSGEEDDIGAKAGQKSFAEAELSDFFKVTIPRRRLVRWCNEPYFEQAVMNFYVRLAIGRNENTQKPCYRLCKVIGVKEGKEYPMHATNGKPPVVTNKWIHLKFGDSERYFKMIMVSDAKPDADDVTQYFNHLKNRRGGTRDVLSKKDATSLRKKQDILINNYTYTTEDIQKSIDANKKITNIALEKTRVATSVQAARTSLDDAKKDKSILESRLLEVDQNEEYKVNEEMEKANENIAALEQDLKVKEAEQEKVLRAEISRTKQLKNNQNNRKWAKVNDRAIAANKVADREAYKKELELQKSGRKETSDPYARRRVKPKNLWNVGQDDKDTNIDSGKSKQEAEKKKSAQEDSTEVQDTNQVLLDLRSNMKKKLSEQINDMSIDEEAIPSLMLNNNKKTTTARVRKGISLSQYFDLKAKVAGSA